MLLGGAWVVGLLIATGLPWVKNPAAVLLESWGLAPSAAALIYYLARFKSPLSAWTENKMAIMLGEASYSIYLLHWVFVWVFTSSVVDANALLLPKLLLAWLMTMLLALVFRVACTACDPPSHGVPRERERAKLLGAAA